MYIVRQTVRTSCVAIFGLVPTSWVPRAEGFVEPIYPHFRSQDGRSYAATFDFMSPLGIPQPEGWWRGLLEIRDHMM